jgi:hypothetical protein
METEKTINTKIIAITRQIQEKHPELIPFLNELPVTIPDESSPEITVKILQEYYESLQNMLKKHA